jgi:hypothetical protein
MKNFRRTLTFGLGAALCVGNAFGGQIIQTFTIPAAATSVDITDAESNHIFALFNSSGFTDGFNTTGQSLSCSGCGVTLQFTETGIVNSLSVDNLTGGTQEYSINIPDNINVDSFAAGVAGIPANGASAIASAEVGVLNSGVESATMWSLGQSCKQEILNGATDTWFTPNNVSSGQVPADAFLGCTPNIANPTGHDVIGMSVAAAAANANDFLGTGNFNLSYTTNDAISINAGLLNDVASTITSQGTFTVIYTYGPSGTPEPTTMLLFGSSLVGLGLLRRRAVKR